MESSEVKTQLSHAQQLLGEAASIISECTSEPGRSEPKNPFVQYVRVYKAEMKVKEEGETTEVFVLATNVVQAAKRLIAKFDREPLELEAVDDPRLIWWRDNSVHDEDEEDVSEFSE